MVAYHELYAENFYGDRWQGSIHEVYSIDSQSKTSMAFTLSDHYLYSHDFSE